MQCLVALWLRSHSTRHSYLADQESLETVVSFCVEGGLRALPEKVDTVRRRSTFAATGDQSVVSVRQSQSREGERGDVVRPVVRRGST